jgi:hypothetical protein
MPSDAVMPVSVVVEKRRAADSRWQDYLWRTVGVLPAGNAAMRGQLLAEGEGWAQFHAGALNIELFRGETEGYLTNLSQAEPAVYVVLRRNEADEPLQFTPFLATVCPYEAHGYDDGYDEMVEGVPMPPEVKAWVQDFVSRHHVDVPFKKRKNRKHADSYGGGRPGGNDWNIP